MDVIETIPVLYQSYNWFVLVPKGELKLEEGANFHDRPPLDIVIRKFRAAKLTAYVAGLLFTILFVCIWPGSMLRYLFVLFFLRKNACLKELFMKKAFCSQHAIQYSTYYLCASAQVSIGSYLVICPPFLSWMLFLKSIFLIIRGIGMLEYFTRAF